MSRPDLRCTMVADLPACSYVYCKVWCTGRHSSHRACRMVPTNPIPYATQEATK